MSKNTNALTAASEAYLLSLLERGAAGKLKPADAKAASDLLQAVRLATESSQNEEIIAGLETVQRLAREIGDEAKQGLAEIADARRESKPAVTIDSKKPARRTRASAK